MAAILLSACTVTVEPLPGFNVTKIVTPATADDADTIDVSSIISTANVVQAGCSAATDGWLPVATLSTAGVLTIPGSTDNELRNIFIMHRN